MSWNNQPATIRTVVSRLTGRYMLLCTLFCIAVFALVSVRLKASAFKRIDQVLADELREFADLYVEEGMAGLTEEFKRETRASGAEELFCRLLSPDGETLLSSDISQWEGLSAQLADIPKPLPDRIRFATLYPASHPLNARLAAINLDGHGVLQLGMSLQRENHSHRRTRRILATGSLMIIGLSTLAGLLIARQAMSGVRRVTRTVGGIRRDNLHQRVPMGREGLEINELADAFNRMLQRIESLIRETKEVSDNIAHDLRSPITRMRGITETTLTGPQDPEAYREMGLTILEECDRLTAMINTMLEISRSEAGVLEMEPEDIDLSNLLSGALDLFRPVAEEKNIQLSSELPESPVVIRGDRSRLQRAVANLLDNALKYTPANGTVRLTCRADSRSIRIGVEDNGIGIAPEETARIFDRFYRSEKSRSSSGNGLGLSLAKAIVRAHRGTLQVQSSPGKGTVFTITLPA